MYPLDDTIAAVASPPGGAARGIVRLSGPRAMECLAAVFLPASPLAGQNPPYAQAVSGTLRLSELALPLPCDVYVWPVGRSYTGQAVVEIHTLGSLPLLQALLGALCAAGVRPAGPGEFTLRAFLAGRIDLTQAEAVLGTIEADDKDQLHVALEQLAGGLGHPLARLRTMLLDLLAHLEAGFEFPDEELPFLSRVELCRQLTEAAEKLATVMRQTADRNKTSPVLSAVLCGRPNVGKSSLFNALLNNCTALVADRPGTTRDYLTAELDLDGIRCRLIDTAGMRGEEHASQSGGTVPCPWESALDEAAATAAARQRLSADLHIFCIDSTRLLEPSERDELDVELPGERSLVVLTKCDAPRRTDFSGQAVETSSLTGGGIAELRKQLRERLLATGCRGEVLASTAIRCLESFRLAAQSIEQARTVAEVGQEELVAAELRTALDELGKALGAVYTEDVLDRVFSRFCIGK